MKVSVVIPVYNKAAYLQECFQSVFTQSYQDMEIIAVDDRSTDGSLELLQAMTDARLRIIKLDRNLGPSGCAQRGFAAAKGEYIVRMDADDVMVPERIAKQVAFMDANPHVGASGSHMQLYHAPKMVRRAAIADVDIRADSLFHIPIYQPSSIYRREVLVRHDLKFEDHWPRYGEDWIFQLRLLKVTQLANLDEALVRYRVGNQNISHGRDNHADMRTLFSAVLAWYGLPVDERSLRIHLHTMRFYPQRMQAHEVVELKSYLAELRRSVGERNLFDRTAFAKCLDRVWDDLAYQLPRFGWKTTWAYLRRDHRPAFAKFRYLLSSSLNGKVYRSRFDRD